MINVRIDPSAERRVLDLRRLGFRDILVLGRYRYSKVHRPLESHSHGDMIEICLLDQGRQTYLVDGKSYTLKGGDVFFTRPRETHGTGGHPEDRGTLYWLLLRVPGKKEPFLSLPPKQQQRLFEQLFALPSRVFSSRGRLKPTLDQITAAYDDEQNPLRTVNLTNWLLRFLLDFIELGRESRPAAVTAPIRRVQEYVEAHVDEPLPVSELAVLAKMSVPRFKVRFRQETGMPPSYFVSCRKIEEARKRLAQGRQSITTIGLELGFSTSQYFATVFQKYAGISPRAFRNKFGTAPNPARSKGPAQL